MRILVVGAAGDVGQAICNALQDQHQLVTAGRKSGDVQVDLTNPRSVKRLYEKVGSVDAVISATGVVRFKPLQEHTSASIQFGLNRKVMGQINLVLYGLDYVSDGGSFTLTSGILDTVPIQKGIGASVANGALAGFVTGAAIEMPRDIRINVVSPGLLDVSEAKYGHMFPGHAPVSSHQVGQAYVESVEGTPNGHCLQVH